MASLCSIKRLHLLSALHFSLCLLVFLFLYLFLSKLNILAPPDSLSVTTRWWYDSIPAANTISRHRPTNYATPTTATTDQDDVYRKYTFLKALETGDNMSDHCGGRYIYVHDLPPKFNQAVINDCKNMCRYLENNGLGHKLKSGWYDTDQFTLEPIFHTRMKQYDCLTYDSSLAAAIYVPFYAGCDISRHLFNYSNKVKDGLSYELANWLNNTPEWRIMGGKDHFFVAGRVTWDFRRLSNNDLDWGNKLLLIPEIQNMSTLLIESSPWISNEFVIPYPTYFHPSNDSQLINWQEHVRKLKRKWLFSFAVAPKPKDQKSVRSKILNQCKHSKVCKLLECAVGAEKVMHWFQSSHFCLLPRGDSLARRYTFEAILAGCIPVFFDPDVQYTWHIPDKYYRYSVSIPEDDIKKKNVSIEETLSKTSPNAMEEKRKEVIDLIPRIVFADSSSNSRTFKDAFDISLEGVISRVTKLRWDIAQWP